MSETFGVSVRSLLIAGVSAAVVGSAVVTPVSVPASGPAQVSAEVELTSLSSGLAGIVSGVEGIFENLNDFATGIQDTIDRILALPDGVQASIKNVYDNVERWPAYVAAWGHFSLGLIPGLWWIAPSIPLAYNTVEPLARGAVYSFADVVGLDLVGAARAFGDGIKTSSDNAAAYGQAWADSFVAVPTLPPYPGPPPGSPDYPGSALPAASTAALAAPQAAATGSGIESLIKNTYDAVEPWVAWGFELAQWGLSFVPGLWWVAPGIDLAYFSIEPLVQAGVYTIADVLGLNFAQIGPDIRAGIQQSAQNAVTYALAWLQSLVPFPPLPPFPPRPGAAVAAPTARAAAAIPAAETAAPEVSTPATTTGDHGPTGGDPIETADAAVESSAPKFGGGTESSVTPVDLDAETDVPAAVESAAESADTPEPAVTEAATEAPQPKSSRGTQRGHRSPVDRTAAKPGGAEGAGSAKAGRSDTSAE